MQDAMDRFDLLSPQQLGQVVTEIDPIGQGALTINDPSRRCRLDALRRELSSRARSP